MILSLQIPSMITTEKLAVGLLFRIIIVYVIYFICNNIVRLMLIY